VNDLSFRCVFLPCSLHRYSSDQCFHLYLYSIFTKNCRAVITKGLSMYTHSLMLSSAIIVKCNYLLCTGIFAGLRSDVRKVQHAVFKAGIVFYIPAMPHTVQLPRCLLLPRFPDDRPEILQMDVHVTLFSLPPGRSPVADTPRREAHAPQLGQPPGQQCLHRILGEATGATTGLPGVPGS